jgi:hypothetical protein
MIGAALTVSIGSAALALKRYFGHTQLRGDTESHAQLISLSRHDGMSLTSQVSLRSLQPVMRIQEREVLNSASDSAGMTIAPKHDRSRRTFLHMARVFRRATHRSTSQLLNQLGANRIKSSTPRSLSEGKRKSVHTQSLVCHGKGLSMKHKAILRVLEARRDRFVAGLMLNMAKIQQLGGTADQVEAPAAEDIVSHVAVSQEIMTKFWQEQMTEFLACQPLIQWWGARWLQHNMQHNLQQLMCRLAGKEYWEPHAPTEQFFPILPAPTLGEALRALQPQVTREVTTGIHTAPWHVFRLACRALLLWVCGIASRWPGRVKHEWPHCLEELAAILECNVASARASSHKLSAKRMSTISPMKEKDAKRKRRAPWIIENLRTLRKKRPRT